ncbi:hypothetical protein TRFO_30448 [Tritrichomonas foetus]|uniref:Protein kinase domain-containing protein n=1 Tax=Tritrichomonas foetus TaxID=1144522 RepID=A0A1J4JY58_9EUKA|nr:hypothetical protein TRFO_30448 [Tritrichomonas foetus]|eukprot:OHT02446.1 hypothetical protein TRFO_30448 [Tritrichomonas foetus]
MDVLTKVNYLKNFQIESIFTSISSEFFKNLKNSLNLKPLVVINCYLTKETQSFYFCFMSQSHNCVLFVTQENITILKEILNLLKETTTIFANPTIYKEISQKMNFPEFDGQIDQTTEEQIQQEKEKFSEYYFTKIFISDQNFSQSFQVNENGNLSNQEFLYLTIPCFLIFYIRRHFFPTKYFVDNRFFSAEIGELRLNDFLELRSIGSGGFSQVIMALHLPSGLLLSIKKYIYNRRGKSGIPSEEEKHFNKEKEAYKKINHPCIVKFYGTMAQKTPGQLNIHMIVLSFMSGGELTNRIKHLNDPTEKTIIATQILYAIDYLHSHGIMHRDIKPSNILLDNNGNAVLCDFGTSCGYLSEEEIIHESGSFLYMSPEQMLEETYSFQTDLYSFGLVLYEICTGYNDYAQLGLNNIIEKRSSGEIPKLDVHHGSIIEIYKMCLNNAPEQRSSSFYLVHLLIEKKMFYNKANTQKIKEVVNILNQEESVPPPERGDVKFMIETANKGMAESIFQLGYTYYAGIMFPEDKKKAFELFSKAAEQEHSFANCYLGFMYLKGEYVNMDLKEAYKCFERASLKDNRVALFNLGLLYIRGQGVQKSIEKAIHYFRKSSELDDYFAFYQLGKIEYNFKNYKAAYELFLKGANGSSVPCLFELGMMHLKGIYVDKNLEIGYQYMKQVKISQNTFSQFMLGKMYYDGDGVPVNKAKAYKYFKKSADQKHNAALYFVGKMHLEGDFVDKDINLAREYFLQSSALNNDMANYELGIMEINEGNFESGFKRIVYAAEKNNIPAALIAANEYFLGINAKRDIHKAIIYYQKAEKSREINPSFSQLGLIYEFGIGGTIQTIDKAINHYLIGVKKNCPLSMFRLALYDFRNNKNMRSAVSLMKNAAQSGNPVANFQYGLYCYKHNRVIESKHYFQFASNCGISEATYIIASEVEKGYQFGRKNLQTAISLYKKAASVYSIDAEKRLKELNQKFIVKKPTKCQNFENKTEEHAWTNHFFECLTCGIVGGPKICCCCARWCHFGHEIIDLGIIPDGRCFCDINGTPCQSTG